MTTEYITVRDIMARTKLGRRTLARMLVDGRFPKPTGRLGNKDVWPPAALDNFMAAQLGQKVPE